MHANLCSGQRQRICLGTIRAAPGGTYSRATDYSPIYLEECGLILFLPFLLEGYIENMKEDNWDGLRYFLMQEMREALRRAYGKGNLTAVDMQKLKQICRKKVWKSYGNKKWMQDLGMQTFMLDAFDTDFSLIEYPNK